MMSDDDAIVPTTMAAEVPWEILATTGSLVLGQSPHEFAVYDGARTYGKWPRTEDGYRFATETYESYAQSPAHGVAYSLTGYEDPAARNLPTDPVLKSQTYAAPLSFMGSGRRIVAWAKKIGSRSPGLRVMAWVGAVLAILVTWAFVTLWYFVVFGLFGILMIPYRLVRRSQRKSLHVQRATLATQQALLEQQRAMMMQQGMHAPMPMHPPAGGAELGAPGPGPLGPGST
jgi:hypothetical protein